MSRNVTRIPILTGALVAACTAALAAGLGACGGSGGASPGPTIPFPTPGPSKTAFAPGVEKQLERDLRAVMKADNVPGAIVGVWAPGKGTWVHAEGVDDLVTRMPMSVDDHVRIASNTKSFTATAVCLLAEQGKLSLDDTVSKFYPRVPEITNGDSITVRQLLNMTSGYFSFTDDKRFGRDFTDDPTMKITPEQELAISNSHEPVFAPGESYYYSDAGYTVLGLIIEEVAGEPAENVITRLVIEPLGLKDTSFPTGSALPEPYSHGYVEKKGKLFDYTELNPEIPWTGGGMVSTLADLGTWAEADATGELLTQQMQREHLGWVKMPGQKMDVRYGLGIMYLAGFVGYHGAIFGYNSLLVYLPYGPATMVIVTNKSTNSSQETFDIFFRLAPLIWPQRFRV